MESKQNQIKALKFAYQIVTDKRNANRYADVFLTGKTDTTVFSYVDMCKGMGALYAELTKPLQPMTLEEAEYLDPDYKAEGGIPVYVERLEGGSKWALPILLGFPMKEYGQTWRCWKRKPTPEESKAVPWEERTYD